MSILECLFRTSEKKGMPSNCIIFALANVSVAAPQYHHFPAFGVTILSLCMGRTLYQPGQNWLRTFPLHHTLPSTTHSWHQHLTSLWHEGNPFVPSSYNHRNLYFVFLLVRETQFVYDQISSPYLHICHSLVWGSPGMRHSRQFWQATANKAFILFPSSRVLLVVQWPSYVATGHHLTRLLMSTAKCMFSWVTVSSFSSYSF